MPPTFLERMISDLEIVAQCAALLGPVDGSVGQDVAAGAIIAGKVLPVIGAAIKAHEALTGKAFDVTLLHQIKKV